MKIFNFFEYEWFEHPDNLLKSSFNDYYSFRKVPKFTLNDIAFIRGKNYEGIIVENFQMFVVADSDLAIMSNFYRNTDKYKLEPIIRYEEVSFMLNEAKNKPIVLDSKYSFLDKVKNLTLLTNQYLILFMDKKTYSKKCFFVKGDNESIDKFISEKTKEKLIFLTQFNKTELIKIKLKFLSIAKSRFIFFSNFIRNQRNEYDLNLSKNDMLKQFYIHFNFGNLFGLQTLVSFIPFEKKNNEHILKELIRYRNRLNNSLEREIKIKNQKFLFNDYLLSIAYLSCGRFSKEKMEELKFHINYAYRQFINKINYLENTIQYLDDLIEKLENQ